MSLKDAFMKSRKINSQLKVDIAFMEDGVDPDRPMLSALIKMKDEQVPQIEGVQMSHSIAKIFTAHQITLNGLKNLIDHPSVIYIEGAKPLFPEQSQGHQNIPKQ